MTGWTLFFVVVGVGYVSARLVQFMVWLDTPRRCRNIRQKMAQNSRAWHYSSENDKYKLHEKNVCLAAKLGALLGAVPIYDSYSGTWEWLDTPKGGRQHARLDD